ncbi:MAG: class I SAM-dependent methyltransferase [Gaiellaceae bacterium MAG52_C11]|nr:class I SAM-dependent methyltransferase [Candidatus Gaiellasilicea maunaloa]
MNPKFSPAWFATFGRPDPATTAREVDFLARVLPRPPASVLDVPCGFGRHAHALSLRGYQVTGVERDPAVAAEARAAGLAVHELDLRCLDELTGTFDAVICMWASFGWFDDETNGEVFAAMAAKTADMLVLDIYNQAFFRTHQGRGENRGVREDRHVEHNRLRTTLDYPDGSRDSFEWRLYEPDELEALGRPVGLRLDLVCADFSEKPPTSETPRTQLVFRRDTQARCENQQPASSSRKTQAFWPDSSTRSK